MKIVRRKSPISEVNRSNIKSLSPAKETGHASNSNYEAAFSFVDASGGTLASMINSLTSSR